MSSAILYVAIVAIWACVLIPRWLHRGTAVEVSEPADNSVPSPPEDSEVFSPASAPASAGVEDPDDSPESPRGARPASQPGPASMPRSREESRRRMLAARRRLLLTLLALEAAAVTLSALQLTALWVLIPPTIMLGGYLLLLREAAAADAERASARDAAAASRARAQAAARARAQARRAAPQPPPARRVEIPEPEPGDYYDLGGGRDYAPGLAGKYETSHSDDVIDITQYKRAVGD